MTKNPRLTIILHAGVLSNIKYIYIYGRNTICSSSPKCMGNVWDVG